MFGGKNVTLANDRTNIGGATQNQNGITIDPSGTYTNVIFNSDDLSQVMSTPLVYSTPLTGISITNSGAALAATPLPTPASTPACATTITNPFPFPAEVIVSGSYNTITKDGKPNVWPSGSFANIPLGVGESFAIGCGTYQFPTLTWFAL